MAAEPAPRRAADRTGTPRALLIVTLATLLALVVALVLAVVMLHQPTLNPVSVPTSSAL